jgi:hypothetical protein
MMGHLNHYCDKIRKADTQSKAKAAIIAQTNITHPINHEVIRKYFLLSIGAGMKGQSCQAARH